MSRRWGIAAAAVLLAFITSAGAPGAYDHYRFMTRPEVREAETEQVKGAIRYFSASVAGFYSRGGTTPEGLNLFPAEKMIKRRIFQEMQNAREAGKLLVMDRDRSTVKDVRFLAPDRALVVVDENWFNAYQNIVTRRPISDNKANFVTVRYFLAKTGGNWIVVEYAVYPQGKPLPPLRAERLAVW